MRYSIKHRNIIFVKGYGCLSFAKNIGTHAAKVAKSISNKHSQKLLDSAKKSRRDSMNTSSKRAIQKTAEKRQQIID